MLPLRVDADGLPYVEEISHPALLEPELASGVLSVRGDGALIRAQKEPTEEVAEIGEDVMLLHKEDANVPTLAPITDEMRPMLNGLRSLFTGDGEELSKHFIVLLLKDPEGWRLSLAPKAPAPVQVWFEVAGCGEDVASVLVSLPNGEKRRLLFGDK